jgi:hypothetical protein
MFETSLMLKVSKLAADGLSTRIDPQKLWRDRDYPKCWNGIESTFTGDKKRKR